MKHLHNDLMSRANFRQVRLHNKATGEYLHTGGEKIVSDVTYSWLGTRAQAANLREKHKESGLLDGFSVIRREGVDQGETVIA